MTRRTLAGGLLASCLLLLPRPAVAAPSGGFEAITDKTIAADKPKLISNPTLLTLKLANQDVRTILDTMARKGGMNLIVDDSVGGQVSLSLNAVPLDEALNLVLKMKNLAARRLGNTLLVATDEVFRKKGFSGREMYMLRFDNAKVDDVESIVQSALSETSGSDKGATDNNVKIIKDTRTNSLLIIAPEDVIDQARALKSRLDIPTPQVEIEVRMLELSTGASRQLGFALGFGGSKFGAGYNNPSPDTTAGGAGNQAGNPSVGGDGAAVTYTALGNFTANFNARVDALLQNQEAKLLASPRVVSQDNKQATIQIVNRHPVLKTTVTQTGTTTDVTTIDVGQSLTITPRIDTAGYVTLDVQGEVSVEGPSVLINGNPVPVVDSRTIHNLARVKDKESLIIGGLKRTSTQTSTSKIPFLGDLPFIGGLFPHNQTTSTQESDIVLVVTPTIQISAAPSGEAGPAPGGSQDGQGGTSSGPPKF